VAEEEAAAAEEEEEEEAEEEAEDQIPPETEVAPMPAEERSKPKGQTSQSEKPPAE
jgi:hypothetical protein